MEVRKHSRHHGSVQVSARLAVAVLAGLMAASAGAESQKDAATPEKFTVKPETIAFGKRAVNSSHTEAFWVRGKGKEAVRIDQVEVQGPNDHAFTATSHCQGTLKLEEDCRIDVTFAPTSVGEKVAELRIVTGDGAIRTRKVTGTAVQGQGQGEGPSQAQYKLSTQSLQFGKVDHDEGSKEQRLTITNTGSTPLPITATSLSGPNEKQFAQSNDCPQQLAPGRSCTSTIKFRPTYAGHHEATLTVWAKGAPESKVALSGTGS